MGSTAYFHRHGEPSYPRDLYDHRCLRIRLGDASIYQWEFEKEGGEVAIDAPGAITMDDSQCAITLTAADAPLA